jgi:hypothetical protein
MPWKMFLIKPAPFMRRSLRRFFQTSRPDAPKLPENHYHDETGVIDEQLPCPEDTAGRATEKGEYANDPRWPKACRCGYVFHEDDHWQVNEERLWHGCPDGKLHLLRDHPPGATWICDWFPKEGPNGQWTGPDGNVWAVMMPAGVEWIIYSHASQSNQKWQVTGTPPGITVSPSILQVGLYHGFIKDGVITEDCDGRKFEGVPRF